VSKIKLNKAFLFFGFWLILFLMAFDVHADVIKSSLHFNTYGLTTNKTVASFSWAPARYKTDFRYDIFYYIPETLKTASKVKSLIFLHGGGQSTMDRPGAIATVQMYLPAMIRLANELGFVLIMPSSNGLNWGAHTRGLLRDLATLMRTELDIDSNLIGVSGHSMGGMGITRNYQHGADEFAFFMPMSSGLDTTSTWQWNDEFLYKVFNVPYVQIQGLTDHFTIFVDRNRQHQERIQQLETKYATKSKFNVLFYDGGHNPDYALTKSTLESLFKNPRNLYQKNLWGSLLTTDRIRTEYNIPTHYDSESRYFWIELRNSSLATEELTHFRAKIINQSIHISMPILPQLSRTLRIYLSEKNINLEKPIAIVLNKKQVLIRPALIKKARQYISRDSAFKFNDFVEIDLVKLRK
jgi:hypothetical protein